jgi:hypothetical protein
MTEFSVTIALELISVINFVVENQKSSIIRDDLEKAM